MLGNYLERVESVESSIETKQIHLPIDQMLSSILIRPLAFQSCQSLYKHTKLRINHQRRAYSSGILHRGSRTTFYAMIIGTALTATAYLGYLLLSDLLSLNPLSTTHLITQSLNHIQKDDAIKNALGVIKDTEKELSIYGTEGARHRRRPTMQYRRSENNECEIGEMTFFVENRGKGIKAVVGVQAIKSNVNATDSKNAPVEIRRLWIDIPGKFHKELVKPPTKPTTHTRRNLFSLLFGQ